MHNTEIRRKNRLNIKEYKLLNDLAVIDSMLEKELNKNDSILQKLFIF